MTRAYDAVVIGAGPGGYVAAIRLAQLGKRTALVERGALGGRCLEGGCIPSKALVAAANLVDDLRAAAARGLVGEPRCAEQCSDAIDLPAVRAFMRGVVRKLARRVATLEEGNGVALVPGTARFVSPDAVEVTSLDGTTRLEAPAFVIATGAREIVLPGFEVDGREVWSARDAVALGDVPPRLAVLGGDATALELATAYAKLGSRVAVIAPGRSILPGVDAEAVRVVERGLRRRGVALHVGARATRRERLAGALAVQIERDDGREHVVGCDRVLVAMGFRPETDALGLEAAGVRVGAGGFVEVDDGMRTSARGIHCVGFAAGPPLLAHKAAREGEIAAEVIAGVRSSRDWVAVPDVIFTDPEVATAGLSMDAARARGHRPIAGRCSFGAIGRALASDRTEGFVKVVADADSKLLLGVTIAGPEAGDLVAEATLALELGASLADVAHALHAHPTYAEALMEACKVALGTAVHVLNRSPRPPRRTGAGLVRRLRGMRP